MESHKNVFQKFETSHIKKIIMVASGKGGVGKSTVASGIALSLANQGYNVGLLDADIHGPSIPTLFHVTNIALESIQKDGDTKIVPFERHKIKIMSIGFFVESHKAVVWRGPMVTKVLNQLMNDTDWGDLDYLIIDTPPGTGDVHITLLQQYAISGVVLVTTPQKVALADVHKAIDMFRSPKIGAPVLGIVENMAWFSPHNHPEEKYYIFGQGGGKLLAEEWNIPLLSHIPIHEKVRDYCDEGEVQKIVDDSILSKPFNNLVNKIK
ncbi:MAG: Mrp/NBP35 family ATP-binding protein [Bacteroidales bacterium]|jgi:ATP-binding protein involved in chromosome partitioning|nr:Mrp/NBP35 family ATP-binding protein [Bacteroidales bacterium]